MAAPLPVTGAWRPGDPPGNRRFLTFATDRPFVLEAGAALRDVTVAYETWGSLDAEGANAVLVCHAWTGDSHVHGAAGHGHPTGGWWEGVVGPGLAVDTERRFVVCANVLGGCQGSTGPSSPHPDDGRPYGSRFPVVTIRDMVRAQAKLADHLGVRRWLSVVGGSMGGMQVLEWGAMFPSRVRSLIPVASCLAASAQQIAWGAIGRRAIEADPAWQGGDYYDAAPGEGPHRGLAVARMTAQVTFRTEEVFSQRFGRELADGHQRFSPAARFEVERYLDYHGDKLVRRFDANSYLVIARAMDLHDLARGRSTMADAVRRIEAPTLSVGVSSDLLYPTYQQRAIRDLLVAAGRRAEYVEIDSAQGHDAFLIDVDQVGAAISSFLDQVEKQP